MKKSFQTLIPFLVVLASLAITYTWIHDTPPGIYQKVFAIGSTVCHQLPTHSFHNDGTQFALCARCAGLYLGSFIGLGYFFTQGRKRSLPRRGYIVLLAALFLFWAGDGLNSFISDILNRPFLYETTNLTRLVSGFGMGLTMATALMTLFNVTVWKDRVDSPLLNHPLQVIGYAGLSAGMGAMLLFSGQTIFTILSYIGIGTVLVIITMLYTVFWVIMTRREMQFTHLSSLWLYFVAGFSTAMVQINLLYILRTWLLG
jgi:uncharacterized membrane protein